MAKPNKRLTREQKARRQFLRTVVLGVGIVGVSLLGYVPVIGRWFERIRPPGALKEQEFLASCIKCGQCVQVCPVNAIKLAQLSDGFGVGSPHIDTRQQACDFSCDGLQCVLACPTGALTHHINYPHETDMGVARVVNEKQCLAVMGKGFKGQARGASFKGKLRYEEVDRWKPIRVSEHPYDLELCDLCFRQCPIEMRIAQCDAGKPPSADENQCPPQHAITFETLAFEDGITRKRPLILDGCVGCGVCEMICPAEPGVFVIDSSESRGLAA
ncbi:MAG: 4Fe-4S dicluster domain-containing protein [Gammaproteobacteria bacterium]|jgi:ferredoxin-type protein NapG|nr:4Fe-4S dicluster domain-containing protein [Gammaproteobacteria bacterium]